MISLLRNKRDRFFARLFYLFPKLFQRWSRKADIVEFKDTPWSVPPRDINRSKLALVTTGGVHLKDQPPFDMKDSDGDPTFREIPADATSDNLMITHHYYDHRDADKDINVVFPIERICEIRKNIYPGAINHRHFSFMGHILNQHITTLINETAPAVSSKLKADAVDAVILTPA